MSQVCHVGCFMTEQNQIKVAQLEAQDIADKDNEVAMTGCRI